MATPSYCLPPNPITDADFTMEEKIKYPHPCHGCFEIKMFYGQCGLCSDPTYGIVRNSNHRHVTDFAHKNEIIINGKKYPPAKYACLYCSDKKVRKPFYGSNAIIDPRLTIGDRGFHSSCGTGYHNDPVLTNLPCNVCCPEKYTLYEAMSVEKITMIPKEKVIGKSFKLIEKGDGDYELVPDLDKEQ